MVVQDKANITPICSATDSKDMVPSEYKTDPMLDHRRRRRPTIEFSLDQCSHFKDMVQSNQRKT